MYCFQICCSEFVLSKIFLKLNGIEKITVDNRVRYFPKNQQSKEKDTKPVTIKNNSNPGKHNEKISQNNKKFRRNISAQGFKSHK